MTKEEIERELQGKPELLKTLQAAETLTDPADLQKVIDFANALSEKRRSK